MLSESNKSIAFSIRSLPRSEANSKRISGTNSIYIARRGANAYVPKAYFNSRI